MSGFTIFPAIDIKEGKCVRLFQGKREDETVFHDDPVEVAKKWESEGARFLHVVDLDGAFEGRIVNAEIIAALIQSVSIPVQVGGGIRDLESAQYYIQCGVRRVIVGTSAFSEDPAWLDLMVSELGDALVVGMDAKRGRISVSGWTQSSEIYAHEAIKTLFSHGVSRVIYTSITRDGTMSGPDFESIAELVRNAQIPIIASGGVSNLDDIMRLTSFEPYGMEGAIIGMALYKNRISLQEAQTAADNAINPY